MKNKMYGTLLAMLMLAGCESKDQKLVRGFAEWMTKKAESEAKANPMDDNNTDYTDDVWFMKAIQDSITYRNALARDADIVLNYVGKCHSANEVWNEIQNAPVAREYGPGSFINENGDWEYGDHVDKGYDKAFKIKVNYNEYKQTLRNLRRIRNVRARGK